MSVCARLSAALLLAALCVAPRAAVAGPKTKVKECSCSIKTPGNWYVVEYFKSEDGVEHLVTASPFEHPGENSVPGVQFLRFQLTEGPATAEEALQSIGAELQNAKITGPTPGKLGDQPGAMMEAVFQAQDKTFRQRYHAAVRGSDVYIVILSWSDDADLAKLEESPRSVHF